MSEANNLGKEAEVGKESLAQAPVVAVTTEKDQGLLQVVDVLKTRGLEIGVKTVPSEVESSLYHGSESKPQGEQANNQSKIAQELTDEYGDLTRTVVVTTSRGLMRVVSEAGGRNIIDFNREIYKWDPETVKDVVDRIQPIIDEIRQKGLTPVVLQDGLSDGQIWEWNFYEDREGREEIDRKVKDWDVTSEGSSQSRYNNQFYSDKKYSVILRDNMGLPVITRDSVRVEHTEDERGLTQSTYKGELEDALKNLGLTIDQVVLLVGHTFVDTFLNSCNKGDEEATIHQVGLDKVKLVPISSLYIGGLAGQKPNENLFNWLDMNYPQEKQRQADVLMKGINRLRGNTNHDSHQISESQPHTEPSSNNWRNRLPNFLRRK